MSYFWTAVYAGLAFFIVVNTMIPLATGAPVPIFWAWYTAIVSLGWAIHETVKYLIDD